MTRNTTSQALNLSISATLTNTLNNTRPATHTKNAPILSDEISSGVSGFQVDRAWEEHSISISSAATVDIDIRELAARDIGAGAGVDAVGQDILNEEIVVLLVKKIGGAGTLEIMPALPANPVAWIPLNYAKNSLGGGLNDGGVRGWIETDTDALPTSTSSKNIRFGAVNGDVTFNLYLFTRSDTDESSSSSISSTLSSSSTGSSSSSSASSTT